MANKRQNRFHEHVQVMKKLQRNGFFFPSLITDADGNRIFYSINAGSAHTLEDADISNTKDSGSIYSTQNSYTQKQLMVQPNVWGFGGGGLDGVLSKL